MICGLLRISCSRNPKAYQILSFFYENGCFSVFCESISHAFSYKHDLLTLVLSYVTPMIKLYFYIENFPDSL